jgi:hypothetical protein
MRTLFSLGTRVLTEAGADDALRAELNKGLQESAEFQAFVSTLSDEEELNDLDAASEADPKRFRNHRMSHFSALRETGPPRTKKVA